jgi:hypothetical protein
MAYAASQTGWRSHPHAMGWRVAYNQKDHTRARCAQQCSVSVLLRYTMVRTTPLPGDPDRRPAPVPPYRVAARVEVGRQRLTRAAGGRHLF